MARAIARPSEMDRLIADLESSDSVRRDAAVARLRVLGARALPRLAKFIESSEPLECPRAARSSALEGLEDPHASRSRSTRAGRDRTSSRSSPRSASCAAGSPQETGTRLLEAITAIAVDRGRDARVRVAALDALSDLPDHLVRPIREQAPPPEAAGPPLDNPVAAREWIEAHGGKATLATLHDAIKTFRDSEDRADTSRGRTEWMTARGAAHQTLAERGSRLALVRRARDLQQRAALRCHRDSSKPCGRIGDASCLEPLARAWSATRGRRLACTTRIRRARRIVDALEARRTERRREEASARTGRGFSRTRSGFVYFSTRRMRVANGLPSTRISTE